jgi:hypothetical protein
MLFVAVVPGWPALAGGHAFPKRWGVVRRLRFDIGSRRTRLASVCWRPCLPKALGGGATATFESSVGVAPG